MVTFRPPNYLPLLAKLGQDGRGPGNGTGRTRPNRNPSLHSLQGHYWRWETCVAPWQERARRIVWLFPGFITDYGAVLSCPGGEACSTGYSWGGSVCRESGLFRTCTVLYWSVLYCSVMYFELYISVLYCTVLWQHCTLPLCTFL